MSWSDCAISRAEIEALVQRHVQSWICTDPDIQQAIVDDMPVACTTSAFRQELLQYMVSMHFVRREVEKCMEIIDTYVEHDASPADAQLSAAAWHEKITAMVAAWQRRHDGEPE